MKTHIVFVFAGWSMRSGGDTRRRVRTAIDFLRGESLHRGRWFVVCLGGRFNEATKRKPAATQMREWMLSERVLPAAQILAETRSRDTFENLSEGFALLKKEGIEIATAELIVITHPWHAERIQTLLHRIYHRSARIVPAWHYLTWGQRFNEIFLHLYLKLDPKGVGFVPRWIRERRNSGVVKDGGIDGRSNTRS